VSDRLPFVLNIACFLITLYLTLSIPWNPPFWTGFADPYDYLHQSQIPLREREFFFPHKAPPTGRQPINFFPRPVTVPLIYKLASSDPDVIVQIQKYFHCLSGWFLVSALLPFIGSNLVRCFVILAIYLLLSWWNVLGWSLLVLSESLSTSFLFCWIASFLFLLRKRNWVTLVAHVLITVLFAFTRDTWPYILMAFYLLLLLFALLKARHLVNTALAFCLLAVVLLAVSKRGATIAQRRSLPLINTIILRIIPDEQYSRWFAGRGLPLVERLAADFRGAAWSADRSEINPVAVSRIYQIYGDPEYRVLFQWCNSRGERTYVQFLLTHPLFTLLFNESAGQLKRILVYDTRLAGAARGYSRLVEHLFPVFSLSSLLVLVMTCVVLYTKQKREVLLVPAGLAVVFLFNVLLVYNADALEVERHLYMTGVMIQLLSIVALAFVVDSALPWPVRRNCS
jgi:hypothetical protein